MSSVLSPSARSKAACTAGNTVNQHCTGLRGYGPFNTNLRPTPRANGLVIQKLSSPVSFQLLRFPIPACEQELMMGETLHGSALESASCIFDQTALMPGKGF